MEENRPEIIIEPKKAWYTSKTLWINAIAVAAIILQSVTGAEVLDSDSQTALLAVINIALRIITKVPLM